MKKLILPIALTLFTVLFRLAGIEYPLLLNVTPLLALFLCFRKELKDYLWIPFMGYMLSDIILSSHYGYSINPGMMLMNLAILWGIVYQIGNTKKFGLVSKTFFATTAFYIITSTYAWLVDPVYTKSFIGWVSALTIGEPGYPMAILFYLSSLVGNLGFAALFSKVNSLVLDKPARQKIG